MANLSQLTLPVKDTITGEVTQQTFNISGGGGGGDSTNFVGTLAQWQALTQAEKNLYDSVDLTDDYYDVEEELQSMADNLYAKQDKTDLDLGTTSKTVVGAINEVKDGVSIVGNQLTVDNTPFYFDSHDGKYGYNTSPLRGADTFVPFSYHMEYIALYANNAETYNNPFTHTFAKDYKKVIIIIFTSDSDNNGDNWVKVFNVQKTQTAWTSFNNDMVGAWDKVEMVNDFTDISALPKNWAYTMNGYTNAEDKNRTITAATGGYNFCTMLEKDNVEKDEQAWIYYNSNSRNSLVILLGMTV